MPSIYRNGIQYSSNGGLESAAITAGVIVPYAGDTAPVGWLLCDGSAVSRTTYSVLFDVIGATYGSGDGSTTFNLPDLADGDETSELLWSNNSTSDFPAQTVSLDLSEYDYVDIAVKFMGESAWDAPANMSTICRCKIGARSALGIVNLNTETAQNATNFINIATRLATVSSTGIIFSAGQMTYAGGAYANWANRCVPYRIWGIKVNPDVRHIISIGAQNGGFTHLKYDSQSDTYNGGVEDEYLLTDDTITAVEAWLNS